MKCSKLLDKALFVTYVVFIVSMICCFRAISSISIGLIFITGLFKNKLNTGRWLNKQLRNQLLAACCLFFLTQLVKELCVANLSDSAKYLQTKTALLIVPLALCCSNFINVERRGQLMKYFISTIAIVLMYCLLNATYSYCFKNASQNVFFYHPLVSPFKQHAVQFSILLFSALVYLLEEMQKGYYFVSKRIHVLLLSYFIGCMLLLSSKLVIIFSAICLLNYCYQGLKTKSSDRFMRLVSLFAGLVLIAGVLFTQNNISKRFREILSGNVELAEQKNFDPAIYFNGLQFRILQGRFVNEILTEHHAWITGVSDSAQILLDDKYISTHMYIGNSNNAGKGYLGYNTHNQFLESLLQSGIAGLLAFVFICRAMVRLILMKQNSEFTFVALLLLAYCFTESVFETQYGLMLFTFLPLFIYYGSAESRDQPVAQMKSSAVFL